jgi:hypothetical protein
MYANPQLMGNYSNMQKGAEIDHQNSLNQSINNNYNAGANQ